jgi:hypothetical protein
MKQTSLENQSKKMYDMYLNATSQNLILSLLWYQLKDQPEEKQEEETGEISEGNNKSSVLNIF